MGLFDVFKKKDKAPEPAAQAAAGPPPQASPWPKRLRGYRDWDDEQKFPVAEELLNEIGLQFDSAKVKRKTDEDELDLRGRVDGVPVRVEFEVDMGWVGVEMKCQNNLGQISLEWDPEKVPVEADDDDDWADDDELRVFVGKAVFIEGDSDDVNQTLGTISRLPDELSEELITQIQNQPLQMFFMHSETLNARFKKNFYEMDDPVAELHAVIGTMIKLAQAVSAASGTPDQIAASPYKFSQPTAVHLVGCEYCGTKFNLGKSSRCPNCGGSHGS